MRHSQRGFTYFGALFLVMLMGAALAGTGQMWSAASMRAKERDLLWIGTQYARALRSYYHATPGVGQYPVSLEELLNDHRFPGGKLHMRRLYQDLITKSANWGLVQTVDNRIAGIYSRSELAPRKTGHFPPEWTDFSGKQRYSDWRFVALRVFQDDLRRKPSAGSVQASPGMPGAPTMPASPHMPTAPMPPQPNVSAFAPGNAAAGEPGSTAPAERPPIVTLPRPPRVGTLPSFSGSRRR